MMNAFAALITDGARCLSSRPVVPVEGPRRVTTPSADPTASNTGAGCSGCSLTQPGQATAGSARNTTCPEASSIRSIR